jgi:hypothetical protein
VQVEVEEVDKIQDQDQVIQEDREVVQYSPLVYQEIQVEQVIHHQYHHHKEIQEEMVTPKQDLEVEVEQEQQEQMVALQLEVLVEMVYQIVLQDQQLLMVAVVAQDIIMV